MSNRLSNIPEIDFLDGLTMEQLMEYMVSDYEEHYEELTGSRKPLSAASPYRHILYACAIQIYQTMLYADRAGRMNMLKYSYGSYLDNLVALRGITRKQAEPAITTLRFSLDGASSNVVVIPQGTRVTNGNDLYFATSEYAQIAVGEAYADVPARCTQGGTAGNGQAADRLTTLVEPIPYVVSVTDITETANGSDTEDDDALAERAYLSGGAYSVAGPIKAYEYHARAYSSQIGDVKITSGDPCEVTVTFLMKDGSLPNQTVTSGMQEYLMNENIRPLTDMVTVCAPETKTFDISLTYYINESDTAQMQRLRDGIEGAVNDYVAWQTGKIGRDINPSVLINKIISAGAKRVEVIQPVYEAVGDTQVARLNDRTIVYGGVEND